VLRAGIDLGGTKTEGIVLNAAGDELCRVRRSTPTGANPGAEYDAIIDNIRDLVDELEHESGSISVVGVGIPGSVSASSGLIRNANTTSLIGRRLEADLRASLGRQVRISNDANCFALAEARVGAGRHHRCVFGVILGTGTGGGIVIDGEVVNGRLGIAGEWGHNPLLMIEDQATISNPPMCYCGRRGCVETWLSGPALADSYVNYGGEESVQGRCVSAEDVVERAHAADPIASRTMDMYVKRFGRALASVINIFDPDVIILGGGLSKIQRLYTDGRAAIEPHVFSDYFDTPLLPAQGGDSAGVVGAAWLWSSKEATS